MLLHEIDEVLRLEAVVADFHRVAQRHAVMGFRQEIEKGGEIVRIELLGAHELPVHDAQLFLQFRHTAFEELLDGKAHYVECSDRTTYHNKIVIEYNHTKK